MQGEERSFKANHVGDLFKKLAVFLGLHFLICKMGEIMPTSLVWGDTQERWQRGPQTVWHIVDAE